MHPRAGQSRGKGVHPRQDPRSLAFSPPSNAERVFSPITWLKLKQESAGWPSWCQTGEQKRDYILRYQEREGIRLDIASIAKNPGRKATAKLMLNSFWCKFGERVNKPTTVTVKEPAHLFSLISNATLDISTLRLCTDDILEAVYTSVQENAVKGTKTNIFVAALDKGPCSAQTFTSPSTPFNSKDRKSVV